MGGCQNYGPFFGYPIYKVPYYNRDSRRGHKIDSHPYTLLWKMHRVRVEGLSVIRYYAIEFWVSVCHNMDV